MGSQILSAAIFALLLLIISDIISLSRSGWDKSKIALLPILENGPTTNCSRVEANIATAILLRIDETWNFPPKNRSSWKHDLYSLYSSKFYKGILPLAETSQYLFDMELHIQSWHHKVTDLQCYSALLTCSKIGDVILLSGIGQCEGTPHFSLLHSFILALRDEKIIGQIHFADSTNHLEETWIRVPEEATQMVLAPEQAKYAEEILAVAEARSLRFASGLENGRVRSSAKCSGGISFYSPWLSRPEEKQEIFDGWLKLSKDYQLTSFEMYPLVFGKNNQGGVLVTSYWFASGTKCRLEGLAFIQYKQGTKVVEFEGHFVNLCRL